jgi:MoaD family protein
MEASGVTPMKVIVEYLGHIRNLIASGREEEVEVEEGSSLADLLMTLSKKYGAPFQKTVYEKSGTDVKPNFIVTINGYLLNQLKGVQTKLKKGDHVILMPIVSGG